MSATIRGSKGLLALATLAGVGLVLRWVTAGSVASVTAQDLTSMAFLTIGTVAWIAYGWLVVAAVATALEQAPGVIGRLAALVAAGITSRGSRALLRSALGVAAVTPLTIGVAHATPPASAPNSPNSRGAAEHSATDWRATEPPSTIRLAETTTLADAAPAGRAELPAKRVVVPDRPTVGAPTRYTDLRTGELVQATSRVVKPGDSLWSIAATELGPEATDAAVTARWPQWYAANRDAIGSNPSLIHPGQVLQPPAPGHPVPPTHQEK